jgi:hypothetical protein
MWSKGVPPLFFTSSKFVIVQECVECGKELQHIATLNKLRK